MEEAQRARARRSGRSPTVSPQHAPPAPASAAPPPQPAAAPSQELLASDFYFCSISMFILLTIMAAREVTAAERRTLLADIALAAAGVAAILARPHLYARPAVRLPYILALRAALVLFMPARLDFLRIMSTPQQKMEVVDPVLLPRTLVLLCRGGLLLFVAVCWLQACIASSTCTPLPPALHLPLLGATVVRLGMRSKGACAAFVAENHPNRLIVRGVYWVLQQAASLLCMGTRMHLDAAAAATDDAGKCACVVWSLEASIGFVLPTLMAWRAQLRAARQPDSSSGGGSSGSRGEESDSAQIHVREGGWYEWICAPVLDTVDDFGGPAVPTVVTAVLAFVGAVVVQSCRAGAAAGVAGAVAQQ